MCCVYQNSKCSLLLESHSLVEEINMKGKKKKKTCSKVRRAERVTPEQKTRDGGRVTKVFEVMRLGQIFENEKSTT